MLSTRVIRCSSSLQIRAVTPLLLARPAAAAVASLAAAAAAGRVGVARSSSSSSCVSLALVGRRSLIPLHRHVPAAARSYSTLGRSKLPPIHNEPMLSYAPGSKERAALKAALRKMKNECPDIPCVVAGKEIRTGRRSKQVMPTLHSHTVCTFHEADEQTARAAVDASLAAKVQWEQTSFDTRATIFLKAADLLSGKYRAPMCAAMMLGQSKNVWQAEIDAAEMADFWRFNAKYAEEIYATQPSEHSPTVWNRMQFRPLEGFIVAISPFNFAAIGANLPSTPALLGNTVVWKPSSTSMLANYLTLQLLQEAGLPPGVINFIPSTDGLVLTNTAFNHPLFAGLHFTGSTLVFNHLWKLIATNLDLYRSYPRVVGETGGKNYHMVHPSADVELVVHQTMRAAFEYQGQKCSALSRAYFPSNLWPQIRERLVTEIGHIKMGQSDDFTTFMGAVIDEKAFNRVTAAIELARKTPGNSIIVGGGYDKSKGYFIEPTLIVTTDPRSETMVKELFGPVLTCYVYPEYEYEETLRLVDTTSPYALTGSLFATDRYALERGADLLRNSSGNFYLNEKCTGAVVGQQAFGGGRGSGTNDKSGSGANLIRWVSQRSIKETTVPITTWRYPHMAAEPEPASATN